MRNKNIFFFVLIYLTIVSPPGAPLLYTPQRDEKAHTYKSEKKKKR